VLRKAVNVGEAVSERLQAFVYEDVKTNRTLLTIRNVGSTGSEVEYLMAVGYDGNMLKEVRLAETVRLGTQQAYTTYLSKLLGSEFDNYTDVKPRMAVLYLKTVKGGVFGSAYMAPPSVMTAAYATSTTTLSSTQTSTEPVSFWTGETTLTSWTATVKPRPLARIRLRRSGVHEKHAYVRQQQRLERVPRCWDGRLPLMGLAARS
jgi:hypothetical protein